MNNIIIGYGVISLIIAGLVIFYVLKPEKEEEVKEEAKEVEAVETKVDSKKKLSL